jgi:hypothetical protein
MKKYLITLFLLVFLMSPLLVGAEAPAPGGPFNTAFRVQNLSTGETKCTYSFYDSSGVVQYTSSEETIAEDDSLYVYTPDVSGMDAGEYSGVVSCDAEVAAVANFSDADSGASFSGISEVGSTWYAPGVYDNYYDFYSNVYVQNASSNPVDITVEIYEAGNATPVKTQTATNVARNAAVSFEQEGLAELSDDVPYSAKISAVESGTSTNANIAAIVNIYGKGGTENQLYSYNPFASGSTTAYAPVIMANYFGYNTALVIQNMGGSVADVKVTYSIPGAAPVEKTYTIDPGSAESLYTPNQGLGETKDKLMAAKVESTNGQPLAVLVNESTTTTNRAASYSGFASGSQSVRTPIVMRRYFDYNTSVTCQNIGSGSTDISIAYAGISGTTDFNNVAAGASQLLYQPSDPLLDDDFDDDFIGSATITSTSEDIVCVVNEDMNEGEEAAQVMDQLYAYNGIGE